MVQTDNLVLARMDCYSVFAVLKKQEKLKTEKMYLLKLFVQNAAQAIRNAELNEKLMQKEKLSVVGKAIGMVMHDLRSPIKNMKLITAMMQEENEQNEWGDLLDQCADQASEIFDDFLDFIKETPVEKQPINISRVINEGVKLAVGATNTDQVAIRQAIPENLVIQGEERKLKRIVMNLVNNAIEILQIKKVTAACVEITAFADKESGKLRMVIRDNGPGITLGLYFGMLSS